MEDGMLTEGHLEAMGSNPKETPAEKDLSQKYVTPDVLQSSLKELQDSISKTIEQGLSRNRQSNNDTIRTEVTKVDKSLDQRVNDRLMASLEKAGVKVDIDSLRREAMLDRFVDEDLSSRSARPSSPQAGDRAQEKPVDFVTREINSILSTNGLTGQEPEIKEYVQKNVGQPWWKVGAGLNELAEAIKARGTDGSTVFPLGTGASPAQQNLGSAYINDVKALREKGALNKQSLAAVRKKYSDNGLDVSKIDLYKEIV